MCNGRNYTWKKFVENSFNEESLIFTILDEKFPNETRAKISDLLDKLFLDQDPNRPIRMPDLVKVIKTS